MDFNGIIFPSPRFDLSLADYENELIFIPKNNDKQCNLGYIPCLFLQGKLNIQSKYYMLFFHGNAEDIFIAKETAYKIIDRLYINILLVEYPGYSVYKSDKSAETILEDSLCVFDYLTQTLKINPGNIIVFGRSIGTGPATYLSSLRKPASLILMSPFTSLRAVAENLVGNLIKFLLYERFTNIEYIKSVSCPIMFIHGQKDSLIPFEQTIKLKDCCNCPYELLLPENMDHNYFDYEIDFIFPLISFLKRHTMFKIGESCNILIPSEIYEIPNKLKEMINKEINKGSSISYCFGIKN